MLQHGCGNFGTARPGAASLAGVGDVVVQMIGVWLYNFAGLQKQQPGFLRRHELDKGFGLVQSLPELRHDDGGVNGRLTCHAAKISFGVAGQAADFISLVSGTAGLLNFLGQTPGLQVAFDPQAPGDGQGILARRVRHGTAAP